MSTPIAIIGGGVSGITTALTLQLLGFDTTCYARHFVTSETPHDLRFSSLYPAASIIPHSVYSSKTESLFKHSMSVFSLLASSNIKSVVWHRHYELFEFPVQSPTYARMVKNYVEITPEKTHHAHLPHRPQANRLFGWHFNCPVAEWPYYISFLKQWYQQAGGKCVTHHLTPKNIVDLPQKILINCTGIWSPELFKDPEPPRVEKGHLLYIADAPPITDENGSTPSYNYTAGAKIYADLEGNACDVYFYPRSNGWILGGSRIKGIAGTMYPGQNGNTTIEAQPEQIYKLNKEIIAHTYGINLDRFSSVKPKAGYRFVRKFEGEGLRLDQSQEYGKLIFHNYGHGGAGVTLSWGCAVEIAEQLFNVVQTNRVETVSNLIDQLKTHLRKK